MELYREQKWSRIYQACLRVDEYIRHCKEMGMGGQLVEDLSLVLKSAECAGSVDSLLNRMNERILEVRSTLERLTTGKEDIQP